MFCFAKFCRLCLKDSKDLIDVNNNEKDSEKTVEKMKFLLPKLIIPLDGYPPWICLSCRRRVNRTFSLFQKWIKSQEILQSYLNKLNTTNEVPNSTLLSIHLVNNSFKLDVIDKSINLNVQDGKDIEEVSNEESKIIDNCVLTDNSTNIERSSFEIKTENEEINFECSTQTLDTVPFIEPDNKIMEELLKIVSIDGIQHSHELNISIDDVNTIEMEIEEKCNLTISDVDYSQINISANTDNEIQSSVSSIYTECSLKTIKNNYNYVPEINSQTAYNAEYKQYCDNYYNNTNLSSYPHNYSNYNLQCATTNNLNNNYYVHSEKKYPESSISSINYNLVDDKIYDQNYDAILNTILDTNSSVCSPISDVSNGGPQSYYSNFNHNESHQFYKQEVVTKENYTHLDNAEKNSVANLESLLYKNIKQNETLYSDYEYRYDQNTPNLQYINSNETNDNTIYSPSTSATTDEFSPTLKKDCFTFSEDSNGNEIPSRKHTSKKRNNTNKENKFHQIFQDMEIASRHCSTPIEYSLDIQDTTIQYLVDRSKSLYSCKTCSITCQKITKILDHCSLAHNTAQDLTDNEYLSINEEKPEKSVKLTVNHELKKFVCQKCDKNFSEFAALYRHVAVHVSNQRFVCDECGKSFPVYRYLSLHKLTHSRIKVYECKLCPKSFRGKDTLRTHEIVHHEGNQKPFTCEICGKGFIIEQYLKIHMKRHNKETGRICHICGKILKNEELCYKHIKEKHLAIQLKECEICHKSFHANRNLKAHMKLHGTKDFKCDQCDKEFFFKRDLDNHHLLHTGFRPHICHFCGKDFRSLGALHKHVKIHTRVKAHVCQICQKGFNQLSTLEVHERVHSGFKPFKCQDCGKGYVKKDVFLKHMKRVHPDSTI